MPDDFEQQDWVRQGVAAALSREYEADARSFLASFAENMERTFPDATEVNRKGMFTKTVSKVTITLQSSRLTIEDRGKGPLIGTRGKVVRGIVLKTEDARIEDLLAELGEELQHRAGLNEGAKRAIGQWLGLE